jgi:hypothetical protein
MYFKVRANSAPWKIANLEDCHPEWTTTPSTLTIRHTASTTPLDPPEPRLNPND